MGSHQQMELSPYPENRDEPSEVDEVSVTDGAESTTTFSPSLQEIWFRESHDALRLLSRSYLLLAAYLASLLCIRTSRSIIERSLSVSSRRSSPFLSSTFLLLPPPFPSFLSLMPFDLHLHHFLRWPADDWHLRHEELWGEWRTTFLLSTEREGGSSGRGLYPAQVSEEIEDLLGRRESRPLDVGCGRKGELDWTTKERRVS